MVLYLIMIPAILFVELHGCLPQMVPFPCTFLDNELIDGHNLLSSSCVLLEVIILECVKMGTRAKWRVSDTTDHPVYGIGKLMLMFIFVNRRYINVK